MAKRLALFILLAGCHTDTKIKTNISADALPAPHVVWDVQGKELHSREKDLRVTWKAGGYGAEKFSFDAFLAAKEDCASAAVRPSAMDAQSASFAGIAEGTHFLCLFASVNDRSFSATNNGIKVIIDRSIKSDGTMSVSDIESTRLRLSWAAAHDSVNPNLTYSVYRAVAPNFDTLPEVEAGTLLTSASNVTSLLVTDLAEASTYYFNVVVEKENGFKLLYKKIAVRTKVRGGPTLIELSQGAKSHQCGIATDRRGYCWGLNDAGQLGTGNSGANADRPTLISGDLRFLEIQAGEKHSCGLTDSGEVYCWGLNGSDGLLGNNSATSAPTPVLVTSSERFTRVVTGSAHSCALTVKGDVLCWGSDADGQQGNAAGVTGSAVPAQAATGIKFRDISAGGIQTCGLGDAGTLYCWGNGQHAATAVNTTEKFRFLATGGDVTCGISEAGKAFCWGKNSSGALGTGTAGADETQPVAVQSTELFRSLAIGAESVCGITTAGAIYCWGANDKGQLGLGDTTQRNTPTLLNHGHDYVKIAATAQSFCASTVTGKNFCWGSDEQEQLGNGAASGNKSIASAMDLSQVSGDARFTSLLAGGWSSCGLTSEGNVYCAGAYSDGNLGYGGALTAPAPRFVPVPTEQKFRSLVNGYDHQCGLTAQGKAYCWGLNEFGELGIGRTSAKETYPIAVQFSGAFTQLVTGRNGTCGLASDGTVYCWGSDEFGQLGNGETKENKNVPVAISNSLKFISLAAGETHNCAITQQGAAYCWGGNGKGQLGDTSFIDAYTPKAVNGSFTFKSVSAGKNHSCGVAVDGASYCWGADNVGQVGNGAITGLMTSPSLVDSTTTMRTVWAGYSFTCAVTDAGAPFCWGSDSWERLGNGTLSGHVFSPQPVATTDTFIAISATYAHACGLSSSNQGVCWGHDGFEQLADGPGATDVNAPGPYISFEP